MRRPATFCLGILALAGAMACVSTWKNAGRSVPMSPAVYYPPGGTEDVNNLPRSRGLSFSVPDGWHWYVMGDDVIATREGVFLQQILVERLHLDQVEQEAGGTGAWSSTAWPVRTAKSLTKRFAADMEPSEAAEVLLASRVNDPSVTDLTVRKIVTRTVAGQQAFRALFDFRLKSDVIKPSPLYRSAYCGFVLGNWFYGISYTAAARYYFDRDTGTFETFLDSVRFLDE